MNVCSWDHNTVMETATYLHLQLQLAQRLRQHACLDPPGHSMFAKPRVPRTWAALIPVLLVFQLFQEDVSDTTAAIQQRRHGTQQRRPSCRRRAVVRFLRSVYIVTATAMCSGRGGAARVRSPGRAQRVELGVHLSDAGFYFLRECRTQ